MDFVDVQSQFHWVELLWKKAAKLENQLTEFALYPSKRMKIFKQKIKIKASNSHDYNNLNFSIDDILISKEKAQNLHLHLEDLIKRSCLLIIKMITTFMILCWIVIIWFGSREIKMWCYNITTNMRLTINNKNIMFLIHWNKR